MGEHGEDRTGGGRRHQACVGDSEGCDAGHAATNGSEDQDGLHQDVREVDLMDATEEMDDRCTGSRSLRGAAAKEHIRQQDAEARAGVGFEEEKHRLALLQRLLDAQRRQHAMVDGVVEEQDLGRLNEDAGQREESVVDEELDHVPCAGAERRHQR
ncbi:hypothetical protein D3C73_1317580 [compost metagenome]